MRDIKSNSIFLCLVMSTMLAGGSTAYANNNDKKSKDIIIHLSQGMPSDVQTYWTADRMRKAVPYDLYLINGHVRLNQAVHIKHAVSSRADITIRPYWNAGKLFFTQGGKNYSCSAEFIGDSSHIITAAHCLRSGGVNSSHVIRCPPWKAKGRGG